MAYKMICLDIDGTLLNSQHQISKKTKDIIQAVSKELHIPVILVSARMPKGIISLQDELNITEPIICYSGALIMDDKAEIILNATIPVIEAKELVKLANDAEVHSSLYKYDEWYVEKIDEWVEQEGVITNTSPAIMDFAELFDIWERQNSGPNKILCMAEPDRLEALNEKINTSNLDKLNIYHSKPTYLEVMPDNASKTAAIKVLCGKYNIQRSEVMAIGDNFNDIDMIRFAGLGIAMGNAPAEVKQYADGVTLSNDEDGVATAIEKWL